MNLLVSQQSTRNLRETLAPPIPLQFATEANYMLQIQSGGGVVSLFILTIGSPQLEGLTNTTLQNPPILLQMKKLVPFPLRFGMHFLYI